MCKYSENKVKFLHIFWTSHLSCLVGRITSTLYNIFSKRRLQFIRRVLCAVDIVYLNTKVLVVERGISLRITLLRVSAGMPAVKFTMDPSRTACDTATACCAAASSTPPPPASSLASGCRTRRLATASSMTSQSTFKLRLKTNSDGNYMLNFSRTKI